jgi:hypothetical protein
MASPFRLFRKYQATLLVIAGVLLMFIFVIGDPLMSYISSQGEDGRQIGPQNPRNVAVRWEGGQLTNLELSELVMRRRIVNAVLEPVEYYGWMSASETGRQPAPLRVEPLRLPDRHEQQVEQHVVSMRLAADAARKMGMNVSDEDVVRYLQELGRGYVTVDHLREIISRLQVGGGVPIDYVLDVLRDELLARNYLASYMFAFDTRLPQQRWDDWLRANDRVIVEAAAIPSESFVIDVPDPSDEELATFFDEHKDREPMPEMIGGIEMRSPRPGFAAPRRIELQFVRADYEKFLEQASAAVTDEEIEKFYEQNKDPLFIRADRVLPDELLDEASGSDAPASAETPPASDAKPEVEGDAAELVDKPQDFQPLEEVRDTIRRQIADLQVVEQLEQLMGQLESELGASYATYFGAVLDAQDAGQALPAPPADLADLSALAEEHGLEVVKTGPTTWLELRELPIGASYKPGEQAVSFLHIAFSGESELYKPVVTFDSDGNRYLVMKIGDMPGRVPTLDEVRDEVVLAWRRQQAAELTLKHAEAEAKKAEAAQISLEEFFADDRYATVAKTDFFSRYTAGSVSPQTREVQFFRLSEPDGIKGADYDVMDSIFALEEGEIGAVLNHDRSIAYVLRVVEHEESPAELRQAFLAEADRWYGLPAMSRAHSQTAIQVLLQDMLVAAGVDWQRPPDQPLAESEEE